MLKIRQKNISIFEFEHGSTQDIIAYIKNNIELIQNYCFAFHVKIDSDLESFLKTINVNYFQVMNPEALEKLRGNKNNTQDIESKQKEPTKTIKIAIEKGEITHTLDNNSKDSDKAVNETKEIDKARNLESNSLPCEVFRRPIRSGEELILHSNNIFLKSINAGAFIKSFGNLQIYGKCDAKIECLGDFIIIREYSMGRISLNGINLNEKELEILKSNDKIKMIFIDENEVKITELT